MLNLMLFVNTEVFKITFTTKAIAKATERINALEKIGFSLSSEKLIGHNGTPYCSYFVLNS